VTCGCKKSGGQQNYKIRKLHEEERSDYRGKLEKLKDIVTGSLA
jgi:hypothetical protein